MNEQLKEVILKELELFRCSILLEEVKENVRKLRSYGVENAEIVAVMNEGELLPQLIITKDYKIALSGEKPIEVKMEPLVKAVYLLFLKHPEGISFKDLPDYRKELTNIYDKVRPWGLTDRAKLSIEDVTNPLLNSINEKCTRIRKAFLSVLDDCIATHYFIKGRRGEAKAIPLPRNLVVWE